MGLIRIGWSWKGLSLRVFNLHFFTTTSPSLVCVPGEVVFAGMPGWQHAEENLIKGRMDSLQQSFRLPAGPPVPNG